MSFIPGSIVKEFTTKSGKTAVIRYPRWEDVGDLLTHINAVSRENIFITFSGEQETLESESKYLASEFALMENGQAVKLFCYVDGQFAGVCDVHQVVAKKERSKHVGVFGLVIAQSFRGEGIGYELSCATIHEAKQKIAGLQIIQLDCFAANAPALGLYPKVGFKEWGRFPQALFHKGEYMDEVHMSLMV